MNFVKQNPEFNIRPDTEYRVKYPIGVVWQIPGQIPDIEQILTRYWTLNSNVKTYGHSSDFVQTLHLQNELFKIMITNVSEKMSGKRKQSTLSQSSESESEPETQQKKSRLGNLRYPHIVTGDYSDYFRV